ncbi:Phage integrase family protein [compost metagenome]
MSIIQQPRNGTNLLQTVLAKPYHYRRSGRYYLRLRPQGTIAGFFTLSLRTTDKATAMTISKDILQTLKAFHLDNPEATWDELRERLAEIAESCLTMAHGDDSLVAYEMIHDDQHQWLREASANLPMTVDQQKAISKALEILEAAQERLRGRPGKLVGLVKELRDEDCGTSVPLSASLSVTSSQGTPQEPPLIFKALAESYIAERKDHVQPGTMRDIKSSCAALGAAFGDLDLKTHTRPDMLAARDKLLKDFKGSTVKKLMARLSAVMVWATDNGYLERSFDKGLKPTKDAESSREAFSPDQVVAVMHHANVLPANDWKRWGLSLGAITGARIEEIRQLTKADIKEVGGYLVIDINRNDGKTLKTKYSIRIVPLVDGAYGFNLKAFQAFVDSASEGPLFDLSSGRFSEVLNGTLRDVLKLKADRTQTFHSFRHSLAGALKAAGVPVGTAQEILGHSSGSISYDLYGAGSGVHVGLLSEALRAAFGVTERETNQVITEGVAE